MVSQRALAQAVLSENNKTLTITTSAPEQVSSLVSSLTAPKADITKIVLVGYYKTTDLQEIGSGAGFTSVTTVDMSEAKFVNSTSGASNDYQLFNESISGVAPKSGDKAIENATLYQYLHTKQWVSVSAPSEVVTAQYSNSTDRDAAIPTTALNAYSKTPTGNYKYCQMTVADESWSRMSITGLSSAIQVDDWYENSLEGHKQNYSNGQTVKLKRYYKKEVASIGWVLRYPSATDLTASGFTVLDGNGLNADMTNLISDEGSEGQYICFWVYYTKTNGSWSSMSMTDPGGAQEKSWLENTMNDHLSDEGVTDGTSVKIRRYYRKEAVSYAWNYVSDPSTVSGGTTYDGAAVGADMTNLFRSYASVGDYIWFWVYYTKNDTRSWTPAEGQDNVPDGFVENGNNVATFDFKDRNFEENKVGYTNGQWVKMPTYTYYQLQQNSSTALSWQVVPFTDGEIKTISYKVASASDLPSTATENQYGVVGGTPKVYDGSEWGDEASVGTVYTYDYSQMKFSQWQSTLTTAITSKYADSNTDNGIFDGCKLLTYVDFKAGTVRGLKDRKGSDYASGLKVIIGKNVSEIDASAFIRCEALTDLVFDKDYTGSAPQNDKLSGVTYPINLTIGDEAFEACSNLKEVEFPNRVTSIGNSAFKEVGTNVSEFKVSFERRYNKDDSNVSIDYDVDLTIGTQAFQGCSTLKKLELPIRLVSMGNDAFKLTTNLEKVTIREDVEDSRLTTIPSGAFEESGIVSIKIPKSITEIQSKAFGSCYALKEVEFQESNQRPQPPLIIRTGAFATGDENSYHLERVKVDYPPSTRLTVCEFNAFNFTSLVGQTNVSSKQIATLEFPSGDESWNFYAGEWKKGLAFSQSTLNAFKDGYNGMRSVDAQPTVASGGLVAGLEPANGWQQFTATNTGREVKIPEGNYTRTYSTATPHYIPIIAGTSSYLYDIFRISAFSDGYKDGDDIYSSAKAAEAVRVATATQVTDVISERKYVPAHTGLIMKIHGNSNDSYIVYQDEVPSASQNYESGYKEYTYPNNTYSDANLLWPSCDDATVPVTEDQKTVYKVVINPTDPYPIGELTGDKYRIFGLWVEDDCFWRSEPGVLINTDMAYLKLKIDQFHWANEDSGTSPTYPSSGGSRIALVFANEDSETSVVSSPVITKESSDCYYTIQGVKLSHPLGRGMYIHNGKKIFVK